MEHLKNFQVTSVEDGKKYWISRSCSVVGIICLIIENKIYFLANQRGDGTPDFHGYWNLPCGYIDMNETGEQAVCREIMEETRYFILPHEVKLFGVETNPEANKQNITIEYYSILHYYPTLFNIHEGGEENEVNDVKWISINDINNYKWAFDHDKLIKQFLDSKLVNYL